MSYDIDKALVQQYRAGIQIKYQQMGSRLQQWVLNETQNGEFQYFDRIGPVAVTEIVTRHADTVYQPTPHDRRKVGLRDFTWSDLIDKKDVLRMLSDPQGPYTMNGVYAMGRQKDLSILQASWGTAYSGKSGGTAVTLPTAQYLYTDATDASSGSISTAAGAGGAYNLSLGKLRRIRLLMQKAEAIIDQQADLVIVVSPAQMSGLLGDPKVTSHDYQAVKALVNGEIDTLLGFKFIVSNLLPLATGAGGDGLTNVTTARKCVAFERSGLLLSQALEPEVMVDVLPGKNYSTQVYLRASFGATRMWEDKVVVVYCDESATSIYTS